MKTVTTINGRRVTRHEARISVFDNAFLYAEGLFETFLCVDDRIIFADAHLKRLASGAEVTGLKLPVSRRQLKQWMVRTARAHPARIKKLRLTITSGESAKWTGRQGKPKVILSASPHTIPTEPFRLYLSEFTLDRRSVFRRIKTLSYAIHAAAIKQAHGLGFDDALLLNGRGHVAEVTSANIFWARNGKVYTPPISVGCLEGTTRQAVIEQSARLNIPISERIASLAQMSKADEVFISSSLKTVVPVALIAGGGHEYHFEPGEIGRSLQNRFRKLLSI